ncbi:pyridoxal phosphate-dependent aminotransferase [Salmonella enterica subsp. enterica serovar Chester]|uniref:cysteine-S-conjugate beta-lyase n=1 Tax=Salmonella enterica subsp. enterica serovar Chester TaxID=149386 RepID=A0A5U6HLB6_SALET|nr:pyridoxal phosphate-dependent aminotransferase [Salmonella enterica subsp. enterica serovar Chester]EBR8871136.1 pyridoxal phosphate-dependent aminotransferase [Salmonella enterica subsp. enterica serovar Chester]EBV5226555.1 pyridoxal phosphate-dependent aminotransferase [Salmonella enterica subsp. enterica serovar Chester]ECW3005037.1 pyridoxal phosphate-dependent aminotransferase [Salmonella enterica subsp. enterica serovar Chester]
MFDFSQEVDRRGTWCTQWDYVADRFGEADLLPFTISDMDFATAPCILEALNQRLSHGVLGYSRWKNEAFLGAITHWFATRHQTTIDAHSLVYGPSVIYMASELIRQWSDEGDGVVVHTPAYDAFYKAIEGNHRIVTPVPLEKEGNAWYCDMAKLEAALARPESKILLLCSPQNPTGKVWTRDELETMSTLCERHGVRVISDEIHMDMVWGNQPHIPWSKVARGDWALLSSGSKSFNIPALTGAYGIIENSESRERYLAALKGRDGLSSPAVLSLTAHIAAYQHGAPWLDALRASLAANMRYIEQALNGAFPTLNWQAPPSTYLAWIDLRPLGIDDQKLQHTLIHQEKVAIMPGDTYGTEGRGFVRLNAGCPRLKLEKGVNGLINAIRTVR